MLTASYCISLHGVVLKGYSLSHDQVVLDISRDVDRVLKVDVSKTRQL